MMPSCLFTNTQLGPTTREEHTIQRSLGGRIRSREVSSDGFNERCGQLIDPAIGEVYADIMAVLGPALPGASRTGERPVQIPGHEGRYVIDALGNLTMRGAAVIARDPSTDRPAAVLGVDRDAIQRIAAQNMPPGAVAHKTDVMPPSQDVLFPRRAVICAEIEMAGLKAALLTFDHLLRDIPDRFTRVPELQDVREFVRQSVMTGCAVDGTLIKRFVLGFQYDADYIGLYETLRARAAFPETPFEHVLLASGDPATRTLDLVFWAFRVDPHAYRVCDRWQGEPFTLVAVNGILANSSFSGAIPFAGGQLLGRPTRRRSVVTAPFEEAEQQQIRSELFERRAGLYRQAVDYIERRFDDIVVESLQRYASLNPEGDHRLTTAVTKRLSVMFDKRIRDGEARRVFDGTVGNILANAPDERWPPRADPAVTPVVNWSHWLELSRECLDALRGPFGLPGDLYQALSGGIVVEPSARKLGRRPAGL